MPLRCMWHLQKMLLICSATGSRVSVVPFEIYAAAVFLFLTWANRSAVCASLFPAQGGDIEFKGPRITGLFRYEQTDTRLVLSLADDLYPITLTMNRETGAAIG